ncbi:MAG TPA: hypothetical protein VLQ90_05225 [Pyrinomonadaceae bacterium]|nr:hypothetical protein [Pyrinomonadaceae bacterium]
MSGELVGEPWNQWQAGPSDLAEDNVDINVVIYRGLDLAEVKRRYPVVRGKSDYRYAEYARAIEFFEKSIREAESYKDGDWAPSVVKLWEEMATTLKNARSVTIQTLGA